MVCKYRNCNTDKSSSLHFKAHVLRQSTVCYWRGPSFSSIIPHRHPCSFRPSWWYCSVSLSVLGYTHTLHFFLLFGIFGSFLRSFFINSPIPELQSITAYLFPHLAKTGNHNTPPVPAWQRLLISSPPWSSEEWIEKFSLPEAVTLFHASSYKAYSTSSMEQVCL